MTTPPQIQNKIRSGESTASRIYYTTQNSLDEERHDSSYARFSTDSPNSSFWDLGDFFRENKDSLHDTDTDVVPVKHRRRPSLEHVISLDKEDLGSSSLSYTTSYSDIGDFLREAKSRMAGRNSNSDIRGKKEEEGDTRYFYFKGAMYPESMRALLLKNGKGHRRRLRTKYHFVSVPNPDDKSVTVSARLRVSPKRLGTTKTARLKNCRARRCHHSKLRSCKYMQYREKAAAARMARRYLAHHRKLKAKAVLLDRHARQLEFQQQKQQRCQDRVRHSSIPASKILGNLHPRYENAPTKMNDNNDTSSFLV